MECMKPLRNSPARDNNVCRFLLAQLYFDSLAVQDNRRDLRSALRKLPEGLDETYDEAMRRIQRQTSIQSKRAYMVLAWISYSFRPLHVEELQHALSVEAGDASFDEEALPDIDSIISVCGGLVAIDGESSIIRLVHYTTQQYFERTRDKFFPLGHLQIAETCLTYLCYETFTGGPLYDLAEFEARLLNYPFLNYAAQYWGHHVRDGGQQKLKNILLEFFNHNGSLACAFQIERVRQLQFLRKHGIKNSPAHVHPLCIAAYFGLAFMTKLLLEQGAKPTTGDDKGRTALHCAIINGHKETVNLLLDWGADMSARDGNGATTLTVAISREYDPMIRPLPNGGATIKPAALHEAVPEKGEAAYKGWESMVQLLLDRGADVEERISPRSYWTQLHSAARKGQENIVTLLLDNSASIDSRDNHWRTPLHLAASGAHTKVMRLLLNRGANVHATNIRENSALHIAATDLEKGVDMVKLLLDQGADVDAENELGETALHIAASQENEPVLFVLLDHGAAISGSRNAQWTLLHRAAVWGNITIVRLLLDRGADVNAKDKDGATALERVTDPRLRICLPKKKEKLEKIEQLLRSAAARKAS